MIDLIWWLWHLVWCLCHLKKQTVGFKYIFSLTSHLKCYLSDHLIDNLTISIKGLERENGNIWCDPFPLVLGAVVGNKPTLYTNLLLQTVIGILSKWQQLLIIVHRFLHSFFGLLVTKECNKMVAFSSCEKGTTHDEKLLEATNIETSV